MSYASCPRAVVNAPPDVVWALLEEPAECENVFDMQINSINSPCPAVAGQKTVGETGPQLFHLKLTFQVIKIDSDRYRLVLVVQLPFGIAVHECRCRSAAIPNCSLDYKLA